MGEIYNTTLNIEGGYALYPEITTLIATVGFA